MMPSTRALAQLGFALFLLPGAVGAGGPRQWQLDGQALAEASGLVALARGRFISHNDSGHRAELVQFDLAGNPPQRHALPGLRNRDWEDIARMHWLGRDYLIVADVGDNRARRDTVQLHILSGPDDGLQPLHSLTLRYPDGARDCEAVAFDPPSGRIVLLSKRDNPPRLYSLPVAAALAGEPATLRFDALLPRLLLPRQEPERHYRRLSFAPTAMDIRPGDGAIVLLNYVEAYLYLRAPGESVADALQRPPRRLGLPLLPQAEGIAFDPDGRRVWVISERLPTRLVALDLPAELGPPDAIGDNPSPDHRLSP